MQDRFPYKAKPIDLIRYQTPSIYALLNNNTTDIDKLPINSSFLTFKDKKIERKYLDGLFFEPGSMKTPSQGFRSSLMIFFIYYTLYLLSTIIFNVLFYLSNDTPTSVLLFKFLSLGATSTITYLILYSLTKSKRLYKNSILIISFLGSIIILNLALTDDRVINNFTSSLSNPSSCNTLILLSFIFLLKHLVLNTFRCALYLAVFSVTVLLIFLIALNKSNMILAVYEVFLLTIILSLLCISSFRYEHISRDVFWKNESRLESMDLAGELDAADSGSHEMNTEIELLIQQCEKIKRNIKVASSMIMYKEIKSRLKVATNELETLKRRLSCENFRSNIRLDNENLDDQDRTFISQVFMQLPLQAKAAFRNFTTMKELPERLNGSIFDKYGIQSLTSVLEAIGANWNFDIWFIHQATGQSIFIVAKFVFTKWALCEEFLIEEEIFDRFFQALEKSYHQNPYHNACHAADVLHSFLYFCINGELFSYLLPLETLASFIAALAHDVCHPALTNRFLIKNRDDIAIQYNDISVLENMHAYTTFHLLSIQGCNILENLSIEDWVKCRKIIIELILETDMSRHFEVLGRFRARVSSIADFKMDVVENRIAVISMALKCADVGHSAKIAEVHEKWTALICEEFFRQGDIEKERKQEISMYCDRYNTDIAKSQAGFIKNISLPLYESWCFYLKSEIINTSCLDQMKRNYANWIAKIKQVNEEISQE